LNDSRRREGNKFSIILLAAICWWLRKKTSKLLSGAKSIFGAGLRNAAVFAFLRLCLTSRSEKVFRPLNEIQIHLRFGSIKKLKLVTDLSG
jgi:hypothetical protein